MVDSISFLMDGNLSCLINTPWNKNNQSLLNSDFFNMYDPAEYQLLPTIANDDLPTVVTAVNKTINNVPVIKNIKDTPTTAVPIKDVLTKDLSTIDIFKSIKDIPKTTKDVPVAKTIKDKKEVTTIAVTNDVAKTSVSKGINDIINVSTTPVHNSTEDLPKDKRQVFDDITNVKRNRNCSMSAISSKRPRSIIMSSISTKRPRSISVNRYIYVPGKSGSVRTFIGRSHLSCR